jgi:hypothetical protein
VARSLCTIVSRSDRGRQIASSCIGEMGNGGGWLEESQCSRI